MLFESHHQAANVFRPDLRVRQPAPPPQGSGRLHGAAAGGRPPLESHASLRAQPGELRRELFLPCRAVRASARITAASPSSPSVFSPTNPRFCSWTKPNSACRTPSRTMSASGIGIGWRRNARSSCWGTQPSVGHPRVSSRACGTTHSVPFGEQSRKWGT
jgi:hypothetical protein